jgi:hypothetical protein
MATMLGTPAIRQILARLSKSEKEEELLVEKIASGCKKFDHKGKASLTPDEYFNVLKLQNGIDCSKDEVLTTYKEYNKIKVASLIGFFIDSQDNETLACRQGWPH